MRQRTADRWERLADKSWHNWEAAVTPSRIAQLLRREHRAALRLVKEISENYATTDGDSGAEQLARDILDRLTQRAQ